MLFTGYADIQAVISAVNEGHIFRYILKPWDSVELEGIIRQGVEQYDLLAERKRLVAELQAANRELVQANEELARAGQLKTAFIEVASHEFNTPITLVLGLAELMRLANPTRSDQEHEILRQITSSGKQLARLVTNMLTLLRAEDFKKTLEPSPVDLAVLIQKVADQVAVIYPRAPDSAPYERGRRSGHIRYRRRQDQRRLDQPADQCNQIHPGRRHDRADGPINRAPGRGDSGQRSRHRSGPAGTEAFVPAVLHATRPQPPLVGRFRLLQARAGSWLEYCKTVRGDAWWTDRGRKPGRGRDAGYRFSAAKGPYEDSECRPP